TVNQVGDKFVSYTKGALDMLLCRCTHILLNGKKTKILPEHIEAIKSANSDMAGKALRVLAFAYREFDELNEKEDFEHNMIFLGLVGMIDPPRPETIEAIKKCFNASLKPIMITGDHAETAFAIAKELGIANKKTQVITGEQLNKMSDNDLLDKINKYSVFARVSPDHKVRIVKAFQKQGKVVAMTGDGVNDAPSLKIADIGVGMGITGTDVTKDVADMIVSDDNFATIIIAVEEGRKIYANIQKTIQFLLSTNAVEVVTLFLACIFLPQYTFLVPSQLLFINFITDSLPAIALGLEPAEKDIMERPPRKNSSNILSDGVGVKILYQAAIQIVILMIMYVMALRFYSNIVATTMVFYTLNFIQLFHSFNLKTYHSLTKINIFRNKTFNYSFLIGTGLVLMVAFVPFLTRIFGLTSLSLVQWLIVAGCSISIIPLVELAKFIEDKIKIERIK
ncbi:MAG: cation-translocating P-type ATPase, partial [Clostridiales bacterium]|nr:cation-translocating P-type ATPase [Candidatus Apopatousia equi]